MEVLTGLGAIATVITACFIAWGIWYSKMQLSQNFEERFNKEYRDLLKDLPIDVLSGHELKENENLTPFFRYFDLSNEECYHHDKKKIQKDTWTEWESGIRFNLSLIGFRQAWNQIQDHRKVDLFSDLEKTLKSLFKDEIDKSGKFRIPN